MNFLLWSSSQNIYTAAAKAQETLQRERKVCQRCEILSLGHHTAILNIISQQLWLPCALVLHKAGPFKSKSQTEEGLTGDLPFTGELWSIERFWEQAGIDLSCVPKREPTRYWWIVSKPMSTHGLSWSKPEGLSQNKPKVYKCVKETFKEEWRNKRICGDKMGGG